MVVYNFGVDQITLITKDRPKWPITDDIIF